jgi:methyl-accepting chemotaxis protein
MNQNVLTVFVVVAAVAIVIQMGVLIALYASSKKTGERLQTVSREMEENLLPMIRDLRTFVTDTAPKLRTTLDNLTAISATVRQDAERFSATAQDVNTRFQQQAARVDEMVTRTLNRVEQTGETVQHVFSSPARQVSGVMAGVTAAMGELLGNRKLRRQKNAVPRDEMFI